MLPSPVSALELKIVKVFGKLEHGYIFKYKQNTPIINILEIIKSLSIREYIYLFPMDGALLETVLEYCKSHLDAKLYNNQNIPVTPIN